MFSLSTGVLLSYARGNKHQHELRLLWKLLDQFKADDLAIADRGFCSYGLLACLGLRGVKSLFRLNAARPAVMRLGKRLGKNDRPFTWFKPPQKPRWLPQGWWRKIPTQLSVRVIRFKLPKPGYRPASITLVTTLLDRISFKGSVDSPRQFSLAIAQARSKRKQKQLLVELLEIIARDKVPDRPHRREPRAVKRRPKPFQLLNRPRHLFKDTPHRSRSRKNYSLSTP